MTLDPEGSERYQCVAGAFRPPSPERPRRFECRPSDVDGRCRDASARPSLSRPLVAPGAACRAGWPLLLCLGLLACSTNTVALEEALARCEARPAAVRLVWMGDLRAPCGEAWLLENAPSKKMPPASPLGEARRVMREALATGKVGVGDSLWLREAGLPHDVAASHLALLAEREVSGLDPWLQARVEVEREDRDAAARLAGWSAWDPDPIRRQETLTLISNLFDLDLLCDSAECVWTFADALDAPLGVPGDRGAAWDLVWLRETRSPRVTGLAGDWVLTWRDWCAGDVRCDPTRPGIEQDPARALWSGGTEEANAALRAELGIGQPVEIAPGPPPTSTPGGRAAALIPWEI